MLLSMACFDLKKILPSWQGGLRLLGWLGVAGLLGFIVWALLWLPPQQVEQVRERLDKTADEHRLAILEDTYRRTLAQSIGGLLLIVGLYVAWRRVKATEENVRVAQENIRVAQENVSVAQENVRVAQEGQVTERFTRAIAQLGDDKMAIRLGGIYALERLAKDSEKDNSPIMEVLTAYVREKATQQGEYAEAAVKPTTDIQAILTVIGRRKPTAIERTNDFLDLSDTHLVGADLSNANLYGVSLHGANLSNANLNGADLRLSILSNANLDRAMMIGAMNLTEEEIKSTRNWRKAILPDYLDLSKPPDPAA